MQQRSPLFVFFEILGDMLGKEDVTGVTAIHHPPRYVEAGTGEIDSTRNIYNSADRAAVNSHSEP
jgi:hypothetical protein